MQKERKLDIFQVLGQIDRNNTNFYDSLKEDEQKAFQPLVVMRWLSGTFDESQILLLNEVVNPYVFSLSTHKPLLYKLMTVCTSGISQRYKWIKSNTKKQTSTPNILSVVCEYYGYNKSDAADVISLLTDDDIFAMAEDLGRQKEEIAKIKSELKNRK